jgi:hypothetical protein
VVSIPTSSNNLGDEMTKPLLARSKTDFLSGAAVHTFVPPASVVIDTARPYVVQGNAHKLEGPLQVPWLTSTQAAPGVLSAVAHSASVLHAM